MIKVPFVINGQDFARITTDISFPDETTFERVVVTQDGVEHEFGERTRPCIEFRVALSREHTPRDYQALHKRPLIVKVDHPDLGMLELPFRLDCNLEKTLQIWNPVENANYYSSGIIRLRCKEVVNVPSNR